MRIKLLTKERFLLEDFEHNSYKKQSLQPYKNSNATTKDTLDEQVQIEKALPHGEMIKIHIVEKKGENIFEVHQVLILLCRFLWFKKTLIPWSSSRVDITKVIKFLGTTRITEQFPKITHINNMFGNYPSLIDFLKKATHSPMLSVTTLNASESVTHVLRISRKGSFPRNHPYNKHL